MARQGAFGQELRADGAEVIAFDDLMACGSLANARSKGLVRTEGKEYVMQDGDVVEFLFNV